MAPINSSANILYKMDKVCDYIPVISSISNIVDICLKFHLVKKQPQDTVYYKHLKAKDFTRCFILLIPILGNIIIGCVDAAKAKKAQIAHTPVTTHPNSPPLPSNPQQPSPPPPPPPPPTHNSNVIFHNLTKITHNRGRPLDPTQFDKIVKMEMNDLYSHIFGIVKAAIYERGKKIFNEKQCEASLKTFRLPNPHEYHLKKDEDPQWSLHKYTHKENSSLTTTEHFFDYKPSIGVNGETIEDVWVDFANASLGGGCFGHGAVQEEIIALETPDFAAHVADHYTSTNGCSIETREGDINNRDRVSQGNPNPYLMKGLHRVQQVDNEKLYGNKFRIAIYNIFCDVSQSPQGKLITNINPVKLQEFIENPQIAIDAILQNITPLDQPQLLNILAIAAPRLYNPVANEQLHANTLKDISNTLMAGFRLVQHNATSDYIIHSGKLGCGAFYNDPRAVYFLHRLLGSYLGFKIVLHGYSDVEAKKYEQDWQNFQSYHSPYQKPLTECIDSISKFLQEHP